MKQKGKQEIKKADTPVNSSAFLSSPRFHVAIITGVALLLYLPTLQYKLTYYDDASLIENMNRFIRERHSFAGIFSQSVFGSSQGSADYYYRPLLTLSLYVNMLIGGTSLIGFHLTNVFIHIGASWLLYFFLKKLKFPPLHAFVCALLFAVHPVLVQAVAWVPGRNDSLLTFFALVSLIFLIQYSESGKLFYFALHLLMFFCSLLTKETAILLPVLYFFTIKIFQGNSKAKANTVNAGIPLIGFLSSWIMLGALFFVIRRAVLGISVGLPMSFTLENIVKNLPALIQYTGKMLLPFNLSTFPILQDTTFIFGILSIAILIYFLAVSKKLRRNYLLLGICWWLLFLLPAILRTSDDYESVFLEHRLYFPIIGFFLLWLETDIIKGIYFEGIIPKIAFGCLIAMFMILSFNHSKNYKDEFNYWSSAVVTSPHSSFAHRAFGTCLFSQGKPEEARKEFETALELNPGLKEIHNGLGRIYLNEGQNDKAEQLFDEELKINPNYAMVYYNLGLVQLNKKNITAAESLVKKSIALDPSYPDAQNDLCVILAMQKKYDEAAQLCIKMLEENPSYESAKKNLSLIFSAWNDPEKVTYYRNLLQAKGIQVK